MVHNDGVGEVFMVDFDQIPPLRRYILEYFPQ